MGVDILLESKITPETLFQKLFRDNDIALIIYDKENKKEEDYILFDDISLRANGYKTNKKIIVNSNIKLKFQNNKWSLIER